MDEFEEVTESNTGDPGGVGEARSVEQKEKDKASSKFDGCNRSKRSESFGSGNQGRQG
eukprot:CAMPEP_0172713874 /NCGR_PEP_ID=MMETSP1074-20121228/64005_1 /TAXON_ID=2916 /ORGANISM="Ceratium fusus, Strain PA161109" /LENGTH=57 /DNA_ID=CAMNT_0013538111 /DNA_START=49 /DNA_END=222 /DNA_ORIENTATION=+